MESLFRYTAAPSPCGYLPDQQWSLEYEYVVRMTPAEYLTRMLEGWRRFGTRLFRPACVSCNACRALRVQAFRFRPDRSQRRAWNANADVELVIGEPTVTRNFSFDFTSNHWTINGQVFDEQRVDARPVLGTGGADGRHAAESDGFTRPRPMSLVSFSTFSLSSCSRGSEVKIWSRV